MTSDEMLKATVVSDEMIAAIEDADYECGMFSYGYIADLIVERNQLLADNERLNAQWESVPFTSILWARGAILSLLILEGIGMTRGAPVEVPRRILIKTEEILAEWLSDNDPRYSDGLRDNDPKGMKDD